MRMIEVPDDLAKRILSAIESFESIDGQLRRINRRLDRIEGIEGQSAIDLTKLSADVAAGRTVDESNKILIEGIIETLEHSQDPAVLALAAQLREQRERLTAAVQENTISA